VKFRHDRRSKRTERHRRRKLRRILGAVAVFGGALVPTGWAGAQGATAPSGSITPNTDLQNDQVVTVNWSGLKATVGTSYSSRNVVGIYECTADPAVPGQWNYYTDCYTEPAPQQDATGKAGYYGNAVDPHPAGAAPNTYVGVTQAGGTGDHTFLVQAGTLHTPPSIYPCQGSQTTGCSPPADIQCDATHACVLKVISFPKGGVLPEPLPGENVLKNSWTWLTEQAADSITIPLKFGATVFCQALGASARSLALEGSASASYALESWAARLCLQGTDPEQLNFSQVDEYPALEDLASGATTMAVASLPPPSPQNYFAAPLDASGVAITFDVYNSANQPITTMRLTPRLVAMLITNSATLVNFGTGASNHVAWPSAQPYSNVTSPFRALTSDPEFEALNPQIPVNQSTPAGTIEPVLPGGQNDDAEILTQWIADDYDARQFLAGDDPCGAPLNEYWRPRSAANPEGVQYPASQFLDLESGTGPGARFLPDGYGAFYDPQLNLETLVNDFFQDRPAGEFPSYSVGYQLYPPSALPPLIGALPGFDVPALMGVFDTTTAARSLFNQAELSAADPNGSELAQYVNESGGSCTPKSGLDPSYPGFVGPTPSGLAAGYADMTLDTASGTRVPPYETTDPTAYPLARIDYGFVPKHGLSTANAQAAAELIDFAAGPGQAAGTLPQYYLPLSGNLANEDLTIAREVLASGQTQSVQTNPTTTTPEAPAGSPANLSGQTGTTAPSVSNNTPAQSAPGGESSPEAVVPAAMQSRVDAAAGALVDGGWLLPLLGILGVLLVVGGGALGWRSRGGKGSKVSP
jgi:hypothetical protein